MIERDRDRMMHISPEAHFGNNPHGVGSSFIGGSKFPSGNNFHICLQTESEKEANSLFKQLSKDGKIEMPMNKTFWGAYFGMVEDKFRVHWMINYNFPQTPNK